MFSFPDYSRTRVLLSAHASTAPVVILTIVAIKHKVLAKIHKEFTTYVVLPPFLSFFSQGIFIRLNLTLYLVQLGNKNLKE